MSTDPTPAPPATTLAEQLPAIPAEWKLAVGQAVAAIAVALGAPLNAGEQSKLVALSALTLTALVAGGTALRRGRAKHLGALLHADPADVLVELEMLAGEVRAVLTAGAAAAAKAPVSRQLAAVDESAAAAADAEAANARRAGAVPVDEPTGS